MAAEPKIIVDNRVWVRVTGPGDPISVAIKEQFTYPNPAYKTWKTFKRGAPPDKFVKSWETASRGRLISVPRGAFRKVLTILGVAHRAIDTDGTFDVPFADSYVLPDRLRTPLWRHQQRLVDSVVDHDPSIPFVDALWRAPQGSGKTQAVLGLILALRQRALVVVSTSSLFEQWRQRVRRELDFEPGVIQGQTLDIRDITIAMSPTLAKRAFEVADQFGFVCLDEAQLAPASTFRDALDRFPARYRLGVSGDERRADSMEFLTYDLFGPVSCEVDREQIVKSGEIVDVEVRVVPTDFRADWYVNLGAEDPSDERQRVKAARDKVQHRHRLLEELTNDQERNELVVKTALRASSAWFDLPPTLAQFIVLSDRVEQCRRVESMLTAHRVKAGLFLGGAENRAVFEITLAGMRNGSVTAGVGTYQAIGVGFEANRELAIGVCASPCVFNDKSRMQFMQYRNRLARSAPGKMGGVMYYLWDRHVYGINPLRLLCRWNAKVSVQTADGWVDGKRFLKDA